MKIGMNLPVMAPGLDRERILTWSHRIDTGPFASLAVGERVAFPNPEILVTLSAAAAVTERVRLLFFVLVLPMHRAALAAKQVATLDVLSGGRVSLGVGVGAREEDYRAAETRFDATRWRRLEQQVSLLRRAWAGESIVAGVPHPIEPRPLQPGGPEILAGSLFPASIRRAARWADGICGFSFGPSVAEIAAQFGLARSAWREAARDTLPRLVTGFWFALGPHARRQMDDYLERYLAFLGPGVAGALAPRVTTLSGEALRDSLKRIEDLGADEVVLTPTCIDPDEVQRVADLLG